MKWGEQFFLYLYSPHEGQEDLQLLYSEKHKSAFLLASVFPFPSISYFQQQNMENIPELNKPGKESWKEIFQWP